MIGVTGWLSNGSVWGPRLLPRLCPTRSCETQPDAKVTTPQGLAHPDASPTRVSGANYTELGRSLGGYAERVEKPAEIIPAIQRARRMNDEGHAVLLEFITCDEPHYSHRRGL